MLAAVGVVRINFEIASLMFDRAIDVNHFFAVRPPAEDPVEERAFAFALVEKIDYCCTERNRHEREIAQIIEQHFELKNGDIPQKFPATMGAGAGAASSSGEVMHRF